MKRENEIQNSWLYTIVSSWQIDFNPLQYVHKDKVIQFYRLYDRLIFIWQLIGNEEYYTFIISYCETAQLWPLMTSQGSNIVTQSQV